MRQQHFRIPDRAKLFVPVIVSLLVQVPASIYWLVRLGGTAAVVTLGLAVLGPLALLIVRRLPGPIVAIVSVAACADFLLATDRFSPPFVSLAFAIVIALSRGARIWAWVSIGLSWTAAIVTGILLGLDLRPGQIGTTTLGILITFGIGEATRARREQFAEFHRAVAQRKQTEVQAERVRIARELHDVLAHSLSQINVQAGVGLHLMDKQPQKAAEALASIKETSKTALDEVRSVLGVLRAEDGQDPGASLVPEPDLSRLRGLAASVTAQGVDVVLSTTVDAAPQAVQLALYRIAQESLTNVLRHAHARSARVEVVQSADGYTVTVTDDGIGFIDSPSPAGGGRGLLGMRERAELLGGTLEVSRSPGGGTRIAARIPTKERQ